MNNQNLPHGNPALDIARLRPAGSFGSTNGGWCYDAYPDLEPLRAGARICIADIQGPAVIHQIHSTQHAEPGKWGQKSPLAARGVVLEIVFDDSPSPSVLVPLGDFFADGTGGSINFTSPFIEKAPHSYNCFFPMPFARRARVYLHNETAIDFSNYSFVDYERLSAWDPGLGYFHATWHRFAFPLHGRTVQPFFRVAGRGQFVGTAWTISTDEDFFGNFHWVMEGNVGIRVDGEAAPVADYLGTEDSFGFSWGWPKPFAGLRNGITHKNESDPAQVTVYRFRDRNVIPFDRELDVRIDWSHDWQANADFQGRIAQIHEAGRGLVDYATTWYWYQDRPGLEHQPMLPVEERARQVLAPNPGQPLFKPVKPAGHSFLTDGWQVSRLMPAGDVVKARYVGLDKKAGWEAVPTGNTSADDFVEVHAMRGPDGLVYLARKVKVSRAGEWVLHVGHDGGARVFVDGKPVAATAGSMNPAPYLRTAAPAKLAKGEHEIVVALDRAGGKGWGIFVSFAPAASKAKAGRKPIFPR